MYNTFTISCIWRREKSRIVFSPGYNEVGTGKLEHFFPFFPIPFNCLLFPFYFFHSVLFVFFYKFFPLITTLHVRNEPFATDILEYELSMFYLKIWDILRIYYRHDCQRVSPVLLQLCKPFLDRKHSGSGSGRKGPELLSGGGHSVLPVKLNTVDYPSPV